MDLLQLEHFLAVVEQGSFTRAATRVFRTQPAISQSVRKLEDEIGTSLLARDVHEVALTEAGRLLADYARHMLRLRDEALHRLAQLKSLSAGAVSIAATETAALYLLPGALHAYYEQFPHIKLCVYRSRLQDIPRQIIEREADVGLVLDDPGFRDIQATRIHLDEMILLARPDHAMVRRRRIRIGDLGQEHFAINHVCERALEPVRRLFERARTPFVVSAELPSYESVKDFVQQEHALAIIPRVAALRELKSGTLKQIPIEGLQIFRRTLMISRDPRYLSASACELVRVLRTVDLSRSASLAPRPPAGTRRQPLARSAAPSAS